MAILSRDVFKRSVPLVAEAILHELDTKQLLARLQKLRACHDTMAASDYEAQGLEGCDRILFKDDPAWQEAFDTLKEILASREHVPKSSEKRVSGSPISRCRPKHSLRR
jgi:hypothetical protein